MINKIKPCVLVVLLIALFSCSKEDGKRNAGDVKTSVVPEGAGKVDFIDHGQDPSALFALANEDYYFEKWTGDVNSTENPLTITVNSPMNITANFKQVPFITMEQVGEGTVYKSVEKNELENKYVAYLSAKPKEGWEFLGWSGDISSTENPLTVTVDAPKNIVATFSELEWEFDGPEIKSFTFSPEEVDVTNSSQVVTVTVHVTDKSGIKNSSYAQMKYFGDNIYLEQSNILELSSGTLKDGVYTSEVTMHKGLIPGEWMVTFYPFQDIFENSSGRIEPTSDKKTLTVINTKYNTPTN